MGSEESSMNLVDLFPGPERAPSPLAELDAWISEVLLLRSDAVLDPDSPAAKRRRLDHLFGAYKARDRLADAANSSDLQAVKVVDILLASFTTEVGRDWIELTGMGHRAGQGWWWERLPASGPVRDDYESATSPPGTEAVSDG
jgi:hypothetical protein